MKIILIIALSIFIVTNISCVAVNKTPNLYVNQDAVYLINDEGVTRVYEPYNDKINDVLVTITEEHGEDYEGWFQTELTAEDL